MKARNFFFAAAGVFLLAASYAVGSSRAQAQAPSQYASIDGDTCGTTVLTVNGDIYFRSAKPIPVLNGNGAVEWRAPGCDGGNVDSGWRYMGNVGGTVANQSTTFGQAKRALSK